MGDKSPKSNNKSSKQKQTKDDAATKQKSDYEKSKQVEKPTK